MAYPTCNPWNKPERVSVRRRRQHFEFSFGDCDIACTFFLCGGGGGYEGKMEKDIAKPGMPTKRELGRRQR